LNNSTFPPSTCQEDDLIDIAYSTKIYGYVLTITCVGILPLSTITLPLKSELWRRSPELVEKRKELWQR
jgi:hypothetical protein